MMTVRALIVDDEPLARERLRILLGEHESVRAIEECDGGSAAIERLRAGPRVDLLFLDIQMPEVDGFAVIRELGAAVLPPVVFVTAYDEHAIRAFEVGAFD